MQLVRNARGLCSLHNLPATPLHNRFSPFSVSFASRETATVPGRRCFRCTLEFCRSTCLVRTSFFIAFLVTPHELVQSASRELCALTPCCSACLSQMLLGVRVLSRLSYDPPRSPCADLRVNTRGRQSPATLLRSSFPELLYLIFRKLSGTRSQQNESSAWSRKAVPARQNVKTTRIKL